MRTLTAFDTVVWGREQTRRPEPPRGRQDAAVPGGLCRAARSDFGRESFFGRRVPRQTAGGTVHSAPVCCVPVINPVAVAITRTGRRPCPGFCPGRGREQKRLAWRLLTDVPDPVPLRSFFLHQRGSHCANILIICFLTLAFRR